MQRRLFFLFLTGCIAAALLLSARPLFWRYLQSAPDAWATLPGEALRDPLPPIRPGITVGFEEVATLTPWGKGSLQINRVTPYPGQADALLVNDMAGRILLVDAEYPGGRTFFDIAAAIGERFVVRNRQQGINSFALHPDFLDPSASGYGLIYTTHSQSQDSRIARDVPFFGLESGATDHISVLSEWRLNNSGEPRIDPTTQRPLLAVAQPYSDHNVYHLAFNPLVDEGDNEYGMLYISVGDGGKGSTLGNDPRTLFGTILRIDPLAGSTAPGYRIPADNPVQDGSRRPEVFAYGFHEPQLFSWDSATGRMLAIDIGVDSIEEVNVITAGGDYGASIFEGSFLTPGIERGRVKKSAIPLQLFPQRMPLAEYDHGEGFAIAGGFVYRGKAIPALQGRYVFGDLAIGRLFYVDIDESIGEADDGWPSKAVHELQLQDSAGNNTDMKRLLQRTRVDMRLAVDAQGEILLLNKYDNTIRRLLPAAANDSL